MMCRDRFSITAQCASPSACKNHGRRLVAQAMSGLVCIEAYVIDLMRVLYPVRSTTPTAFSESFSESASSFLPAGIGTALALH